MHGGELLGVEEVGALEVGVAVGGAGLDRGDLRGHVDHGLRDVLGDLDGARDLAEVAADLADHEVAGDEADLGVRGVDGPGAGGDLQLGGGAHAKTP